MGERDQLTDQIRSILKGLDQFGTLKSKSYWMDWAGDGMAISGLTG